MYEIELKARLSDPATIEARAAALGPLVKESLKEDVYYRPEHDTNPLTDDRYRLRQEGGQVVVTFKKALMVGHTEVNQEVEFTVDDAAAFQQFSTRFGFVPFVVKRKQSRVYRVGRVHVELNEVDKLGHFAELEILCQHEADIDAARHEIATVLAQLGLSDADVESRRYIDMLQNV